MSFLNNIVSSIKESQQSASSVVGIDIGSSSVKVVEIEDRKDVLTLLTYGEIQLGPYVGKEIGKSVNLEPKEEQQALVDVIRESAVKSRSGVFAMPLSSSFVTNVSIDAPPDSDLSSMVRVEARKVIPASLSEVTLDWAEVGLDKLEDSNDEKHNVLIAAIQNNALERFKILMQFAGMKNPPTEIECFSTIRSLYRKSEDHVAIVDLGASSAKLYIAQKGLLMRMYRIRAGGTLATKAIADDLEIDFATAEDKKYMASSDEDQFSKIKSAHNRSYDRAFREFRQVIAEYEKRSGVSIDTVYLSGGGALFPGIDSHLQNSLEKPVFKSNPFSKISYPAFMEDTMHEVGPTFTVALGAALRAFE